MTDCATCLHSDEHGWHGLPTGETHCRDCHKGWRGTRAAHCPMCHETFGSDTACEAHKVVRGGHLKCRPPGEITVKAQDGGRHPLFAQNPENTWVLWRSEVMA